MISAYAIDYETLYEEGCRGIIFDIDNTLVPHGAPADDRAIKLIYRLKEIGYQVLFLSNNDEERVKMFNAPMGCRYIYKAGKPLKKGYIEAVRQMGCSKENTICVGDQLFTDMWGANKAGIKTFLVMPIDKKEEIQIILKRIPEKMILLFYKRYCKRNGKEFIYGKIQ